MEENELLKNRGVYYGEFPGVAAIANKIRAVMMTSPMWESLSDEQMEALHMIANKLGRILNGDPKYADSWKDIAGYAQLVVNELEDKVISDIKADMDKLRPPEMGIHF